MEGKLMQIQYVLTKAEWDDYHEANHILTKIKSILSTSGIYNHELSIPAMTMYLVAKNDELNASHKTLKEVTEQRDMLAEAIRKHKTTLRFAPDFCDVELYEALQSLNPDHTVDANDMIADVKGGSDDFDQFRPFDF
jgi:hypothetical protein